MKRICILLVVSFFQTAVADDADQFLDEFMKCKEHKDVVVKKECLQQVLREIETLRTVRKKDFF